MKSYLFTLSLFLLCSCNGSFQKIEGSEPEVKTFKLDNGLSVLLVKAKTQAETGISLSVAVGSYMDPAHRSGLAHYLEHMVLLGTEKYPEPSGLMAYAERHGGYLNAHTSSQTTAYHFQIPNQYLDRTLDQFSEYFISPLFSAEYSDKEVTAVDNEWRGRENSDATMLHEITGLTGNPAHPAQRMDIGNRELLTGVQPELLLSDIKQFYKKYYSANNMTLAVVSDLDLNVLEGKVKQYFSAIDNNNLVTEKISVQGLTPKQLQKHIYYPPQKNIKELYLEFSVPNSKQYWQTNPTQYFSQLITTVEPGSFAGTLREKGLLNAVYVNNMEDYFGSNGIFRIEIVLTDEGEKQANEILAALFFYIDLIKTNGINEQYFSAFSKNSLQHLKSMNIENPHNTAWGLSNNMHSYPAEKVWGIHARFEEYDKNILGTFADNFTYEHARIWHIGKQFTQENAIPYFKGGYSISDFSQSDIKTWYTKNNQFNLMLPPAENFVKKDFSKKLVSSKYKTPLIDLSMEGIETWLTHSSDHQSIDGFLQLQWHSAIAMESPKNYVLGCLVNDIYALNSIDLLDSLGASYNSVKLDRSRLNSQIVNIDGPAEDQTKIFNDFAERFYQLEFEQTLFDRAKTRFIRWKQSNNSETAFDQALAYLKSDVFKNDFTDSQQLKALELLTLEDVKDYYRQVIETHRVRIYAFGNYSQNQITNMAKAVEVMAGDAENRLNIKRAANLANVAPAKALPAVGRIVNAQTTIHHSNSVFLDSYYTASPSYDLEANLFVLQQFINKQFFKSLRTEQELGYVVHTQLGSYNANPSFHFIVETGTASLQQVYSAIEEFKADYLPVLESLDATVIDRARDILVKQNQETTKDIYIEMKPTFSVFDKGVGDLDSIEQLTQALKSVNKDSVIETYKNLILAKNSETLPIRIILQAKGQTGPEMDFVVIENASALSYE